ncbi:MAG: nucleotidyltransferase family protein [Gemmatimonadota bacterium]|jgi:NDP-sugar pyrophosphorylase family protein|nr:nucleotidyltransferase family protein [Gemmatimonadota bacterium]
MEAMIFAAGLGTRLGDLTRDTPKALIPVGGVPMLERVARRLIDAGADRLIINVHHHADQIADFLRERNGFGVDYAISREVERPLDTGGGLQHAAGLFRADAPFFVHNADILSRIDLRAAYDAHLADPVGPLATLLVMERPTSRYLLFDDIGLVGRFNAEKDEQTLVRQPEGELRRWAFSGVHVASPSVFAQLSLEVRSILDAYLDAVLTGCVVAAQEVSAEGWIDIGKPARLEEAERIFSGSEASLMDHRGS